MHKDKKKSLAKKENNLVPLRQAMNKLFDESFLDTFSLFNNDWIMPKIDFPRVDISENDKEIIIKANVPGIDPKNIDIEMEENWISISGWIEKEEKEEKKKDKYYRYERQKGSFSREFTLPSKVNPDKAEAIVKDGVLTISIPKIDKGKKKKVKVSKKY